MCSVVVLRLRVGPASVSGNAGVGRGGRVVVQWWCVGVEEGEIGGGRWCRVSVGWQSASEAAGFGRRLAAAATDGARQGRARQEQARRASEQPASKAVCQGGERQQVAVSERQTPAKLLEPFAMQRQRQRGWGE